MNIVKVILALLGLIFGVMLFFWLFGVVTTLLWYGFWITLFGAAGYGVYRLFTKAERKFVGDGASTGYLDTHDTNMSWEEYDRKYLNK